MASPYWTFAFVGLLDMISVHFVLPLLDNHMKTLGFNHIQIGLIGAAFYGCQMISSPIIGSLSDVRGRKPVLLFCLVICSFAYFWLGITSSFLVFFSLRIVIGIFKHVQILTRAFAPDYLDDPNDISALYGKLLSFGNLGTTLGTGLGGYVTRTFPKNGFTIMSALVTPIFLINTALINSLPEKTTEKKDKSDGENKSSNLYNSIGDTYKQCSDNFYSIDWNRYWDIFLFKLILSTSIGLYYSNFSLFLETKHELSPTYLGYIGTFQAVVSTIILETVSITNKKVYSNDTDYSQRIFHVFLVIVLSLIGLALVPNVYLYVALVIPKAIYFSLARMVTLEVLTSRCEESNRGALIGILYNVGAVSRIVTPIISGVINHYLGVTYVFFTGAMFASIGLVLSCQSRSRSLQEKNK